MNLFKTQEEDSIECSVQLKVMLIFILQIGLAFLEDVYIIQIIFDICCILRLSFPIIYYIKVSIDIFRHL